jgi:4-amino-4-deoxy-L-arabinose transferase-like glycosyltransferase
MPLVNPILGFAVLTLVFFIGVKFFDRLTASLSVLLLACSPFFLANVIGAMSHTSCALFVCLACYFCLTLLSTLETRFYWLTFISVGLACQIRPLTGLAVGIGLAAAAIYRLRRERRPIKHLLIAISVVGTATLTCSLLVHWYYTGNPFLSPYAVAAHSVHVREVDFTPLTVFTGLVGHHRREFLNTLLFTGPFWLVLTGYAFQREDTDKHALLVVTRSNMRNGANIQPACPGRPIKLVISRGLGSKMSPNR